MEVPNSTINKEIEEPEVLHNQIASGSASGASTYVNRQEISDEEDQHSVLTPNDSTIDELSDENFVTNKFGHSDNIHDEEELKRIATIERTQTHKSIDQYLQKQLSRTYTHIDDEEKAQGIIDIHDLEWESPQDPANPANWKKSKKWFITFVVAILSLCCTLGSSLYTTAIPELMIKFHSSQELCIAGLTFYMLGLAIGPALTAPLSEIIGRKFIYIITLPIGMLFTLGVSFAKNIETILVLRFFCGYFLSPALAVAGGTITDLWSENPKELGQSIALFCLAPFLGPVCGPVIGGFASEHKGWKWTSSYILLMLAGAILPLVLIIPETYKPIILSRRAKSQNIKVKGPVFSITFINDVIKNDLVKPLHMLVTEPIVFFLSVYISFIMAVLFGFFEAFPIIFVGVYHMGLGTSGLPFIAVGIGLFSGIVVFGSINRRLFFNKDGTENIKYSSPEGVLIIGKIGSLAMPISLFWLGWTSKESIHWIAPTAAGIPFGFGLIMVFFSVLLYFSKSFPTTNVASALGANNILRYSFASIFPLFTVQMYDRLHIGWASSLFAFIALALVPVPFVFSYYGEAFRKRSKYGYEAYERDLNFDSTEEVKNFTDN
ncbi:putative transporter of major facilitator superfamily [Scheffersomyces amazonensis]|uniref:putative transporter of major facilitator superfamily n=1 Tax=Scheffersomyces amazonensis TaxID=1078765 RepID=UPI00315D396F